MKKIIYLVKLALAFVYPGKVADSVNRARDCADFDDLLFGGR